jgi:hypothetical protein
VLQPWSTADPEGHITGKRDVERATPQRAEAAHGTRPAPDQPVVSGEGACPGVAHELGRPIAWRIERDPLSSTEHLSERLTARVARKQQDSDVTSDMPGVTV